MNKLFTHTAAAALLCAAGMVVAQADVGPPEAAAIEIAAATPLPVVVKQADGIKGQ